jgi:hypothetical protein
MKVWVRQEIEQDHIISGRSEIKTPCIDYINYSACNDCNYKIMRPQSGRLKLFLAPVRPQNHVVLVDSWNFRGNILS